MRSCWMICMYMFPNVQHPPTISTVCTSLLVRLIPRNVFCSLRFLMCPSSGLLQSQQCVFSVVNISCGELLGVCLCTCCPTCNIWPMVDTVDCLIHTNVWKSMENSCSCMEFLQSRITRESVSGTASHTRCA